MACVQLRVATADLEEDLEQLGDHAEELLLSQLSESSPALCNI